MIDYLNIGSGDVRIANSLSMDSDLSVTRLDVYGDANAMPFKDNSFKGIIAHHVLEHIPQVNHMNTLSECWRVLKQDGEINIRVPDFETLCKYFYTNYLGARKMWHWHIFGRQAYSGDAHVCGFTNFDLAELLFESCFCNLKWSKGEHQVPELVVRAKKGEQHNWRI